MMIAPARRGDERTQTVAPTVRAVWMDFFQGTAIDVGTEMDLSFKKQFIDLVLIRKGPGPISATLARRFRGSGGARSGHLQIVPGSARRLGVWELIGHFVNYRKQSSPSLQDLLPENDYRLFAVCARYPQRLAKQVTLTRTSKRVFTKYASWGCGFGSSW